MVTDISQSPLSVHGRVLALSISKKRGIPKVNVAAVNLIENWGVEGDAHAGDWHRQVSLLAMESIAKMRAKGASVRPGIFAENITTEGVDIPALRIGDRIKLGQTLLQITQIGKECHNRCAIYDQVGDCVMPREGIFAVVRRGGQLQVGETVTVDSPRIFESTTKAVEQ